MKDYAVQNNAARKLLIVINPHAGMGKAKQYLPMLKGIFLRNGFQVTVYATRGNGKTAEDLRERADLCDILVCCGGDGTLNETVSGIMQARHKPLLGYIPLGTTNDFASTLHIPKNPVQAAKDILNGGQYAFDVGSLNLKYFTYVAAFGAFTEVSYSTPQENKNVLGKLAYFLEGINRLSSIQSRRTMIESRGRQYHEELIFGAVTNSTSVAGFQSYKSEDIGINDGVFEALFIRKPQNFIELQSLIMAISARDFSHKLILAMRTSEMNIHTEDEIPWTVDGEFGGAYRDAEIQNHHSAVTLLLNEKVDLKNKSVI